MFSIKCPNCGASIDFLPVSFKLYRQERRECSACGTQVRPNRKLTCVFAFFYGLIFVGVVKILGHWKLPFFLNVIIFMVFLFTALFFMFFLGRWEEVIEEEKIEEEKR